MSSNILLKDSSKSEWVTPRVFSQKFEQLSSESIEDISATGGQLAYDDDNSSLVLYANGQWNTVSTSAGLGPGAVVKQLGVTGNQTISGNDVVAFNSFSLNLGNTSTVTSGGVVTVGVSGTYEVEADLNWYAATLGATGSIWLAKNATSTHVQDATIYGVTGGINGAQHLHISSLVQLDDNDTVMVATAGLSSGNLIVLGGDSTKSALIIKKVA